MKKKTVTLKAIINAIIVKNDLTVVLLKNFHPVDTDGNKLTGAELLALQIQKQIAEEIVLSNVVDMGDISLSRKPYKKVHFDKEGNKAAFTSTRKGVEVKTSLLLRKRLNEETQNEETP